MAYYRSHRRRARVGGYRATSRRSYGRRYGTRRRVSRRRTGTQRVVIQVIGGSAGGVPVSAVTLGKKSARVVRRRY